MLRRISFRSFLAGLVVLLLAAARAQQPAGGVLALLPEDSVTHHTLTLGGRTLATTATAGTIPLFDRNGERSAALFYTAYVLDDVSAETRPVTFVFNGGPGAASAYLQLGLAGAAGGGARASRGIRPKRACATIPTSWLAFTDLVFVDPVGAGWSRAA